MKTKTCIIVILLAGGLSNSHAQDTWTQKADFGGIARGNATGFSIGSKGYLGTGLSFPIYYKDFWEYDPSANAWTQKADFGGTARRNPVGFSIGSKGYIGTGNDGSFFTKDFWEYDPASNVWTQKADFGGTARSDAVGFSIDSKGYVGTGYDGSSHRDDFWEYDPATNAWIQKASFGGLGRSGAVGFSIGSKGYIGTGVDAAVYKDFWEYDPASNTWTQRADFGGTARYSPTGFSIGSKGYIGTGQEHFGNYDKDFWEYDPASNIWAQKADFGGTARFVAAGFSIGSKGYIGTGLRNRLYYQDFWEYTPATAQTPGTWTATGSMSTARSAFTATLLNNGKVLVAGGVDGAGLSLASAELYDPSTGQWVTTGAMTTPRDSHRAMLLPDGRVLVAGGETASCTPTATAELYDPVTGTWSGTGSMNDPRSNSLAAVITEGPLAGMVLVAGGDPGCGGGPATAVAEFYDPNTGTWSRTTSMSTARNFLGTATLPALPSGSVLAVGGGTCCPYHWFNTAESFDPLNQSWTPTTSKTTTAQGDAVLMPNGVVLVAGGLSGSQPTSVTVATAELFDSSTGTWASTSSMSVDRDQHTLTVLASGQGLAAGGYSGGWGVCSDLTSAELYDLSTRTWFLTGSLTTARKDHTATLLPNGQVLAAGGSDCEGNVKSSAELYTPPPGATLSTTSLTFGAQLVNTRSAAQTATLTNTGTTTLTISSIAASGDFVQKNDCGSSVPAGESCTIKVAFKPSAKGVRTGAVTITDDAANSPQTINLRGTGTVVQVSPSVLDFGDQIVGTTSDPQTATITNIGSEDLQIFGIGLGGVNFGDFAETTTCGSRLTAGGTCTIDVTFTPGARGHRHASLKIVDDGGASPQAVYLAGIGAPR